MSDRRRAYMKPQALKSSRLNLYLDFRNLETRIGSSTTPAELCICHLDINVKYSESRTANVIRLDRRSREDNGNEVPKGERVRKSNTYVDDMTRSPSDDDKSTMFGP